MLSRNLTGSALRARRFVAACVVLMTWLAALTWSGGAIAWPQEVGPFVYAAGADGVSVVDSRTNKFVAKIVLGDSTGNMEVAPDGRTVYVAYHKVGDVYNIAAIDTATNTVAARVQAPGDPGEIKINPDGKSVYVACGGSLAVVDAMTNTLKATIPVAQGISEMVVTRDGARIYLLVSGGILAIDAATNQLMATIAVGGGLAGLAVTPDGQRAVISQEPEGANQVLIIDLSSKKIISAFEVYFRPTRGGAAISPDGKRAFIGGQIFGGDISQVVVFDLDANTQIASGWAGRGLRKITATPDGRFVYVTGDYVTYYNDPQGFVEVIDARTNKFVAGTSVHATPGNPAVTPDGAKVYVPALPNGDPTTPYYTDAGKILVFGTATNRVVATIPNSDAGGVAIIPPPPGLPFSAFAAAGLGIVHGTTPKMGAFNYYAYFTLGAASNGIHPDVEPVTLELGAFSTAIPAGSFVKQADGSFGYLKWINGVLFNAYIGPQGGSRYLIHLSETGLNLPKITNPVQVRQIIGDDSGTVAVKADLN
jgi:YVTN family beta-propeller protein